MDDGVRKDPACLGQEDWASCTTSCEFVILSFMTKTYKHLDLVSVASSKILLKETAEPLRQ